MNHPKDCCGYTDRGCMELGCIKSLSMENLLSAVKEQIKHRRAHGEAMLLWEETAARLEPQPRNDTTEITAAAHAANYEAESEQETMTAKQLHALLSNIIRDGQGDRPVFIMIVEDGLTHADPIMMCFASQPYDGEVVWIR